MLRNDSALLSVSALLPRITDTQSTEAVCTRPLGSSLWQRAWCGVRKAKVGVSVGSPRGTEGFYGERELWGLVLRLFSPVSAPKLPKPEIHTPGKFPL